VGVADSQGHGLAGHSAAAQQDLPPGHPSVDGSVANPHVPSK
jgi:hypothetical protein